MPGNENPLPWLCAVAIFFLSCFGQVNTMSDKRENQKKQMQTDMEEKIFIGQLVKNLPFDPTLPDRYCLEDGNLWLGAPCRLGRLNVFSSVEIPAELYGQTVLATGFRRRSLGDRVVEQGPCTEENKTLQFRSDWLSEEGGAFTTRQRLRETDYLEITAIRLVALLRLPAPLPLPNKGKLSDAPQDYPAGQLLDIVVSNPFSFQLDKLRIVFHYEGGPGKDTPLYKTETIDLPPGGTKTVQAPGQIEEEWKDGAFSVWYFHSAYLIDSREGIEFLGPPGFGIDGLGVR